MQCPPESSQGRAQAESGGWGYQDGQEDELSGSPRGSLLLSMNLHSITSFIKEFFQHTSLHSASLDLLQQPALGSSKVLELVKYFCVGG